MGQKKFQLLETELIDFRTIAITTNEYKSYKFVFHLNKELGVNFKRINNLDSLVKKKRIDYMMYESHNPYLESSIYLIENLPLTSDESALESNSLNDLFTISPRLLPELKNCNYIMKIEENNDFEMIEKNLKNNPQIQFLQIVDNNKLKSIKKLIF